MSIENEVNGGTEGPFVQFEKCTKDEKCRYRDNDGLCIFETCIMDDILPPANMLWYFTCVICKRIDCINPRDMKMHVCSTCIERMQAREALPVTCRWCGATISSPPNWMFSGLCNACESKIKAAANCAKCGRG